MSWDSSKDRDGSSDSQQRFTSEQELFHHIFQKAKEKRDGGERTEDREGGGGVHTIKLKEQQAQTAKK